MLRFTIPVLSALLACASVIAQTPQGNTLANGKLAFSGTDLPKALKIVRPLAEAGDADAQEFMGEICSDPILKTRAEYSHIPVPCDMPQAVGWYRKAAEQANAKAQYELGVAFYLGHGISMNKAEAFKWLLRSVDQGHPNGMCTVGNFYRWGWGGVAQDDRQAPLSGLPERSKIRMNVGMISAMPTLKGTAP